MYLGRSLIGPLLLFVTTLFAATDPALFTIYSNKSELSFSSPAEINNVATEVVDLVKRFSKSDSPEELQSMSGRFDARLVKMQEGIFLEMTDLQAVGNTLLYKVPSVGEVNAIPVSLNGKKSFTFDISEIQTATELQRLDYLTKGFDTKTIRSKASFESNAAEDVFALYDGALKLWNKDRIKYSKMTDEEYIRERIGKDQLVFKIKDVGVGEPNQIDGNTFIRVVHKKTEQAFMFMLDKNHDPESSHLNQYIARQHIMSGAARADGKYGRDVTIITIEDFVPAISDKFKFVKKQHFAKPVKISAKWAHEYARSMWKKPDLSSTTFGLTCGLAQAGMNICAVSLINFLELPGAKEIDYLKTSFLPFVWGSVIGANISTYKSWTNHGKYFSRFAKNASNSILYYWVLTIAVDSLGVAALNPFTAEGMTNHLAILLSVTLSNISKPYWYDFSKVREMASLNRRSFKFLKGKMIWSQAAIENQLIYLIPFMIRQVDAFGIKVTEDISLGKVLLASSAVLAMQASTKWAEVMAKKYPGAKTQEIAFRKRMDLDLKKYFFTDSKIRKDILTKVWARVTDNSKLEKTAAKSINHRYTLIKEKNIKSSNMSDKWKSRCSTALKVVLVAPAILL